MCYFKVLSVRTLLHTLHEKTAPSLLMKFHSRHEEIFVENREEFSRGAGLQPFLKSALF